MKRYSSPPRIPKACRILRGISTTLAATSIALMALLMIVEVALRYFFAAPLGWNVSFIQQYLMIGLVFLGLSYAYRSGSHISVDLLYDRGSPRLRKLMNFGSSIIMLITLGLIIWASLLATYDSWRLGEIPPPGGAELTWPTWTWRALIPLGATLMWVEVLYKMANDFFREDSPQPQVTTSAR